MWTDDPVMDEIRYTAELERKEQEWERSRPECPYCNGRVGRGEYVDISGDMTNGYVWHKECFYAALMENKFSETEKEIIFDCLNDEYGGEER